MNASDCRREGGTKTKTRQLQVETRYAGRSENPRVSPPLSFARLVRPGYDEYSARARRRARCTKRCAPVRLDAAFALKRISQSVLTIVARSELVPKRRV